MSKKTGRTALVIAIVGLLCSVVALGLGIVNITRNSDEEEGTAKQYVMYVGTLNKESYLADYTPDQAKTIVDDICLKYFDGYTLQEATGAWVDDKNISSHEYTLVCYFDAADKDVVHQAADEVLEALNQDAVLIEEQTIKMDYYTGNK